MDKTQIFQIIEQIESFLVFYFYGYRHKVIIAKNGEMCKWRRTLYQLTMKKEKRRKKNDKEGR